jgi:VWFA-related protein
LPPVALRFLCTADQYNPPCENIHQPGRRRRATTTATPLGTRGKSCIFNGFAATRLLDGRLWRDLYWPLESPIPTFPCVHAPFGLPRCWHFSSLRSSRRPARAPLAAQAGNRERTLFVSAINNKGEPVEGLGPDAFLVREDGVRREVLRVSRATEPIDIALLIDNSRAARDEITYIRDAASRFITLMAPNNQIALITLADRPTIVVDYTGDAKRLLAGAGRLFALNDSGMTLLDGIAETAKGLEKRETPRAVIVPVFTDGTEFTNRYSRDVAAAARQAQATLDLVSMGQFFHSEEHGIRERSFLLDEGPRVTGGHRISLLAPMGLPEAMERLARELSSQYKVVYGRPESLIPPEKIEVTSARPNIDVHGTPARGKAGV